jgi:imidazoleglycerol-phosphate dehydratase/histidinol-phosphatase
MLRILESEGVVFDDICIDRSFAHENLPTRKPGTGMLQTYVHGPYDLSKSFVIGDRESDIKLAENLGCKSVHISDTRTTGADLSTMSWEEIFNYLSNRNRTASVHRSTSETNIEIDLNLDGAGRSEISTGIGFFDHMLDQISRHGGMDLSIHVKGDLHIDPHHTIEDTGLALGKAFIQALGSKKGIGRYGFTLPMDDCLARVAIDFGGRPWLNWHAEFKREKVGEMPTEMFSHFFKSFSDTAKCNLDIRADGENEHHKIESIFKAFARSLKMAVERTGSGDIPSTKGML